MPARVFIEVNYVIFSSEKNGNGADGQASAESEKLGTNEQWSPGVPCSVGADGGPDQENGHAEDG